MFLMSRVTSARYSVWRSCVNRDGYGYMLACVPYEYLFFYIFANFSVLDAFFKNNY